MNIEKDNYCSSIDHDRCPEYGILQTRGATYNENKKGWTTGNLEREYEKEFDILIFYCTNKEMTIIEEAYIIPKIEILKRDSINIRKDIQKWIPWYQKYRVDEKPYNDILCNLDDNDLKGLRRK